MLNAHHPGETIEEALEHRGITVTSAASALGLERGELESLLEGRGSLDPDLAERLEDLLGIPAAALMRLQFSWDARGIEEDL